MKKRNIKILWIITISVIILIGFKFLLTDFHQPVSDDKIAIVTDNNGCQTLYAYELPTYWELIGCDVDFIDCFHLVSFSDTIPLMMRNGDVYHIRYNVTARIDKRKFTRHDVTFLEDINSDINKYVRKANNDIKFLCVSIPVKYDKNAMTYINISLPTDIKDIMQYHWFTDINVKVDAK